MPYPLDAFRRLLFDWINGKHSHAEGHAALRYLGSDTSHADHAQRLVRKMDMRAVDVVDGPRTASESVALGLSADRLPAARGLVANVVMNVSRKAQDIPEYVVGDDVGKKSPHVGQLAGVRDQLREYVVLETGCHRLHPAKLSRRG